MLYLSAKLIDFIFEYFAPDDAKSSLQGGQSILKKMVSNLLN